MGRVVNARWDDRLQWETLHGVLSERSVLHGRPDKRRAVLFSAIVVTSLIVAPPTIATAGTVSPDVNIDNDDSTPAIGTELVAGKEYTFDFVVSYNLQDGKEGVIKLYLPDAGGLKKTKTVTGTGSYETITITVTEQVPSDMAGENFGVSVILESSSGDYLKGDDGTYPVVAPVSKASVSTSASSGVGESSATLDGSLDDTGGADSVDVWFRYRQSGASTWQTTTKETYGSSTNFDIQVSGLQSNTQYEFRAVAQNSEGTVEGSTMTFTTDEQVTGSIDIIGGESNPPRGTNLTSGKKYNFQIKTGYSISGTSGKLDLIFSWTNGIEASKSVSEGSGEVTLSSNGTVPEEAQTVEVSIILYDGGGNILDLGSIEYTVEANGVPKIDSYSPSDATPEITEGDEINFSVQVSDPNGDSLTTEWYVDNLSTDTGFNKAGSGTDYSRIFDNPGDYAVEVRVSDGQTTTTEQWTVSVTTENKNRTPSISRFRPDASEIKLPEGGSETFEANATDPDWDIDGIRWFVDGVKEETDSVDTMKSLNRSFDYTFADTGAHTVRATVFDSNGNTESVKWTVRIESEGQNARPDAQLSYSPESPTSGETITLTAKKSDDPNGDSLSYKWDFDGDGTTDATGETVTRSFDANTTVELTVSDGQATDSATATVTITPASQVPNASVAVTNAPDSVLIDTASGGTINVTAGTTLTFDAGGSNANGGRSLTGFDWSFDDGSTASGPDVDYTFSDPGTYTVQLTVEDSGGVTDSVSVTVDVEPAGDDPVVTNVTQPGNGRIPQVPGSGNVTGLPNTWRVRTTSADSIANVTFDFPGAGTVTDSSGEDGWTASPNPENLTDGPLVITVTDADGDTARHSVSVTTLNLPAWGSPYRYNASSGRVRGGLSVGIPTINADAVIASMSLSGGAYTNVTHRYGTVSAQFAGGGNAQAEVIPPSPPGVGVKGTLDVEGTAVLKNGTLVTERLTAEGTLTLSIIYEREVGLDPVSLTLTSKVSGTVGMEANLTTNDTLEIKNGTYIVGITVVPASVAAGVEASGVTIAEVGVTGELGVDSRVPFGDNGTRDVSLDTSGKIEVYATLLGQTHSKSFASGSTSDTAQWRVQEKRTEPPENVQQTTVTTAAVDQLTDDGLGDRSPSLFRSDGQAVAVWSAQDGNKTVLNGSELAVSRRTAGNWSAPRNVTSNQRYDASPAVAAANGTELIAWGQANSTLSNATVDSPADVLRHLDVEVLRSTATGWTSGVRLTNDSTPQFRVAVAGTADGWLVAWVEDVDRNLTTTTDRRVRYAVLAANATTVQTRGTIEDGRRVAVASNGSTFTLAALVGSSDNRTARIRLVAEDGSNRSEASYDATNASLLAAGTGGVVWVSTPHRTPAFHVVRRDGSTVRTMRPAAAGVAHVEFFNTSGRDVLTYEGTPTVGSGSNSTLLYQIRAENASGWTAPRALETGNRTIQRVGFTATNDSITAVFAATPSPTIRADIYATSRGSGPADLDVTAERVAGVPENESVRVTVVNDGWNRSTPTTIRLTRPNGSTVNRTVTGLDPGESVNLTVDITKPRAGTAAVGLYDDGQQTAMTTVELTTNLSIRRVSDRVVENGSQVAISVEVGNDGPLTAKNVTYEVRMDPRNLTGRIRAIGVGETWTTTVRLNATLVNASEQITVVVDPQNNVTDESASSSGLDQSVTVRSPDLGIVDNVRYLETPNASGTRARVTIRNSDTGAATARLTFETPNGTVNYTVPVQAARSATDVVQRDLALQIPGVAVNETVNASIRPMAGQDARLTDNAASEVVSDLRSANNTTVKRLGLRKVTANGTDTLRVHLRNPSDVLVGEILTVRRNGSVVARRGVAVDPASNETVTVSVSGPGEYTVAVASERTNVSLNRMLATQWTFDTPGRLQNAEPAVGDQLVYVGGLDDTIYALYRENGSVAWTFNRSGSLADSSPLLHSGTLYVGSGGGVVYALNATAGTSRWTYQTDSAVVSSPARIDGTVVVGSNDGTVLALNASTGAPVWTYEAAAPVYGTVEASNDSVYVTTDAGELIAIDAASGSHGWTLSTDTALGHSSPIAVNGTVYLAGDVVYAVDASTGTVEWKTAYGGTAGASPVVDGTTVYVGAANGTVTAIDASTGRPQWRFRTGSVVESTPEVVGAHVVVGAADGTVYLLDASTGTTEQNASVGALIRAPAAVAGDFAYVGDSSGTVTSLANLDPITNTTTDSTTGTSDTTTTNDDVGDTGGSAGDTSSGSTTTSATDGVNTNRTTSGPEPPTTTSSPTRTWTPATSTPTATQRERTLTGPGDTQSPETTRATDERASDATDTSVRTPSPSSQATPGFTALAALVALVLGGLLGARRRYRSSN